MSIKPIDYNVILPKTQELSNHKHIENVKQKNIVDSTFIQREKEINRNKKKVLDTEKSSHTKINKDNESKSKYEQGNKKKKSTKENPTKKKKANFLGHNIDIQV